MAFSMSTRSPSQLALIPFLIIHLLAHHTTNSSPFFLGPHFGSLSWNAYYLSLLVFVGTSPTCRPYIRSPQTVERRGPR